MSVANPSPLGDVSNTQSQVSRQLEIADNEMENLSVLIQSLMDGLVEVLRPEEPPEANKGEAKPADPLVPMAGDIRRLHQRISTQARIVNDMTERLEV